jgi:Uma2 family endonuclease
MKATLKLKPAPRAIPPLENGDRLSATEFMRRYEATPDLRGVQLIEGIVYMPPPIRFIHHGQPDNLLQTFVGVYAAATPGVAAASGSTVRLDLDNVPEPDAQLIVLPEHGGQVKFDKKGYVVGAPDLVVETAASAASIDMHATLRVYRRNGVREYLVWLPEENEIVWFSFAGGEAERLAAGSKGRIASRIFPGLVLDVRAALARDAARVLATLATALKTSAHREFVSRLSAAHRAQKK